MKQAILSIALAFLLSVSSVYATPKKNMPKNEDKAQITCLAKNVYFEARNQNEIGQIAVAFVTMKRVRDSRYPNSVCEVIKQGYTPGRRDCQFSWYCDGKSDIPDDEYAWQRAVAISTVIWYNYDYMMDPTSGATHYHASYVSPHWKDSLKKTTKIGTHIFYRWEQN